MKPLSALASFAALAACAVPAHAQVAFDEAALRRFVGEQVAAVPGVTRFEVQFAAVETQRALAPCARTEPFLPARARPWGRVSVGVRCIEGANWSVLLPATVRAWGPALVAAAPLAAGSALSPADVREEEVELTREGPLVLQAAALAGKTLARAVAAGQPLRQDMLRVTQVVQAGDPVRLRVAGAGFALTGAGQALASAADGQAVRVRTDLGRVLTGVAREGRVVDIAL